MTGKPRVPILMDEILRDCVDEAYEKARLGRTREFFERDRVFAEILAAFEMNGAAMRYVDAKGRIAWKATPKLRDHLNDLRVDAETDLEQELA
jgi:hypothetical protein